MQKINAVWIPLRARLLSLAGNKEGFLAVLGTDVLFEVTPDGLEYPKMMEALRAQDGVNEFRCILGELAGAEKWDLVKQAVNSISPKTE